VSVTLLPLIDSNTSSMYQCVQLGRTTIGPLACTRMMLACRSASMFSLSFLVSGRSMISCNFTQWELSVIPLHHRTIRSWIVMMRSQSHFVLWKILSDFGILAAVTADSLLHKNCTDYIYKVPVRNNVPRTASPATSPPSYDPYEVISDWISSSGPPPRGIFFSSFLPGPIRGILPKTVPTHLWQWLGPLVHRSQMAAVLVVMGCNQRVLMCNCGVK
jgi:hypothetical protein